MKLQHLFGTTSFCLIGALTVTPMGAHYTAARAAILIKPHHIKIEKEDTISEALDRHFRHRKWRIWGKNGALVKIAALNPHIKDLNRLKPGMLIDIGEFAGEFEEDRMPASTDAPLEAPTPLSQPTPQPTPDSQSDSEVSDNRYGLLWVASEFLYSRINAADKVNHGTATYLSNLSPGMRLAWGQRWSNRFQTSLNFGLRSESYLSPPGYTLESSGHTMTDFGIGASWVPFEGIPNLSVDSRFEFRQELFVRATSLTSTALDPVVIPELMAGLKYRILDLSPFSLTFYMNGIYLFPNSTSNYSIQAGSGIAYGGAITQTVSKKVQLIGNFWHVSQSQDSTIATQNRTDIGLTFGVMFRFDGISKPERSKGDDLP